MTETGRADQVLGAAEQRMRAGGYHSVSFRDVASDVGIRSASVHHHFPQKVDLGLAMVRRYRDRFLAGLGTFADAPPSERLHAFCDAYRQSFRAEGAVCLCGMLGAESAGLPDAVRAAVREFFAASIAWGGRSAAGCAAPATSRGGGQEHRRSPARSHDPGRDLPRPVAARRSDDLVLERYART